MAQNVDDVGICTFPHFTHFTASLFEDGLPLGLCSFEYLMVRDQSLALLSRQGDDSLRLLFGLGDKAIFFLLDAFGLLDLFWNGNVHLVNNVQTLIRVYNYVGG